VVPVRFGHVHLAGDLRTHAARRVAGARSGSVMRSWRSRFVETEPGVDASLRGVRGSARASPSRATGSASKAAHGLHGIDQEPQPAARFTPPRELTYEDVRASALTQDDLDDGVRGINASLDLIRRTRGGWPTGAVTAADNYVDLVWHQFEFRESYSFAYVVRRDHGRYLGCWYLYPMGRRVALTDDLMGHDVDVSAALSGRRPHGQTRQTTGDAKALSLLRAVVAHDRVHDDSGRLGTAGVSPGCGSRASWGTVRFVV
jgi:hypothetical protein